MEDWIERIEDSRGGILLDLDGTRMFFGVTFVVEIILSVITTCVRIQLTAYATMV